MKKLIYTLVFMFTLSLTFVSCTEQELDQDEQLQAISKTNFIDPDEVEDPGDRGNN